MRRLGADHPETLLLAYSLGCVRFDEGQTLEAAKIHRQTLEARKRVLGTGHPKTLESADKLATAQERLAREEEGKCAVCLDRAATWIYEACGHMCICKPCARKQKESLVPGGGGGGGGGGAKKEGGEEEGAVARPHVPPVSDPDTDGTGCTLRG